MIKMLVGLGLGVFVILVIMLSFYALSWIITCGLIHVVCTIFGWKFSLGIATIIWLLLCLFMS